MKALITGASSGIGKDIAKELSKKGYDLILVARNEERLREVEKEIETKCEIICMDLSIKENCMKLYEMVDDVDLLVNNAGLGAFGEFINIDLEKELKIIETNIMSLHILTKLFLADMIKKNRGQILNVASIAGFMPGPLMAAYYASKAYVLRLSEAIREELRQKKSDVRISVLCPGPVDTNFNNTAGVKFSLKSLTSKYVAEYTIKKIFKKRFMIIPGRSIKLLSIVTKFVPNKIIVKFVYKSQKKNSVKIHKKRS